MRLFVPFLLLLLLVNNAWSQSGSGWQWTGSSSFASQSPGRSVVDIHTDAAGNVYTIGYFMGNMTIGAYTISTLGDGTVNYNYDQDAFIAKYDANGNIQWLKRYGVAAVGANDKGQVIKTDADGNVYAGIGYGTPDLIKYDANGNLLWKKTLDLYEIGGINISPDGNLIVMTSTAGAKNIFKLDKTDGSIIWQVNNTNVGSNAGSTYQDFVDAAGNIYYTCFNSSAVTATLAGQSFTTSGLTTFIASLDNNGNRRWVQKMDNVQVQLSYTIDKNGKSYIQIGGGFGGTFQGISTASPLGNRYFELDNQGAVSRYAFASPYKGLFRVKDDGIYVYTVETGGTARTVAYGDYYVAIPAATTKSIGIIIKYNASNDQVVWVNSFEMTGQAYVAGSIATIETGPGSKVQVGGAYGTSSAFGAFTNTATPGGGYSQTDLFVAQFDGANVAAPAVATWTGAAGNTSWSDAGNWNGGVPNAATKAVIPSGLSYYPQGITAANLVAKLEIGSGVSIGLPIGFAAPGGIVNMGSIEVMGTGSFLGFNSSASPLTGSGRLIFTANSPSSIFLGNLPGSLEINKPGGTVGYSGGNIAGSLYLTNGTLGISPYDAVLTDPAATVTYSSTSYINYGRLKRAVSANGTYAFPIGSSSSYTPVILQLKALAGPQFITAGFTSGTNITPNLTINGSVVSTLLNVGRWSITADAPVNSGTYTATFESSKSTNGVTDAARYVVLKRAGDNSNWGFEGKKVSSLQTGGTNSSGVVSNATVTMVHENLNSFGDFAIGVGSLAIADATQTNTSRWTGTAGNNLWTDAANWDNGVPTSLTKAVIPGGVASYPNIISGSTIGKLEVEAGAEIKLPNNFQAPSGIVNNGSIEVTGSGSLKGFGNSNNGYAALSGSGKLVFKITGITGISAQGAAEAINQNIEIVNIPGFSTNNLYVNGNVTLTNSIIQDFTMTNPDAILSYTSGSYSTGTINRAVKPTGSYSFPFVNGAVQVNLNNAVGPQSLSAYSSTFTGSGTAPNTIVAGQTVDKLLNTGTWTVTPNTALTGGSYTIKLSTGSYDNGVTDASRYIVLKRPNSSGTWAFVGSNGTSTQTGGTNNGSGVISNGTVTVTAGNITGFSDFAIGIASGTVPVALPVKLNGFTATAVSKNVTLNWQTSAEVNNDKFVVEKSRDGAAFTAIGEVRGSGNSSIINNYSFKDNNAGSGVIYYRLKQVDADGRFDYSEIRMVNIALAGSAAIKVFPNPFVETVYITGLTGSVQFKLFTPAGQLLMDGLLQNNQLKLPAALHKGMYILQLKKKEEVKPYLYFLQK